MNHIHRIRRLATTLAGLATGLFAMFVGAPAAFAQPWPHPGRAGAPAPAPAQIHTVVAGGTPGWQIALVAAGAAILAAATAVLLDRARTARRHTAVSTT